MRQITFLALLILLYAPVALAADKGAQRSTAGS